MSIIDKYDLKFHVERNNIKIVNSWKVCSSSEMNKVINAMRKRFTKAQTDVLQRANDSMITEWRAHNFLFFCRVFPSHTNDVDLDTKKSNKFLMLGYHLMSFLYNMIERKYTLKYGIENKIK
ncbi:MAG: hypothetical protein MJZ61_05175 [Bacteroidales bacterium]|nr:hypothetical protein [Bacteroidales bacterium]